MVSADNLLERKFIYPDDPDYKLVPIMAVWHYDCPKCGVRAVSSSQIGVRSRLNAHIRKCNDCTKCRGFRKTSCCICLNCGTRLKEEER